MFTEHFCIAAGEHLYSKHLFNIFGFLKNASVIVFKHDNLKVDGNENEGDREGHSQSGSVWCCGDQGLL
jgi:hypothetical protein